MEIRRGEGGREGEKERECSIVNDANERDASRCSIGIFPRERQRRLIREDGSLFLEFHFSLCFFHHSRCVGLVESPWDRL